VEARLHIAFILSFNRLTGTYRHASTCDSTRRPSPSSTSRRGHWVPRINVAALHVGRTHLSQRR
jgi:hypothetical protein